MSSLSGLYTEIVIPVLASAWIRNLLAGAGFRVRCLAAPRNDQPGYLVKNLPEAIRGSFATGQL